MARATVVKAQVVHELIFGLQLVSVVNVRLLGRRAPARGLHWLSRIRSIFHRERRHGFHRRSIKAETFSDSHRLTNLPATLSPGCRLPWWCDRIRLLLRFAAVAVPGGL